MTDVLIRRGAVPCEDQTHVETGGDRRGAAAGRDAKVSWASGHLMPGSSEPGPSSRESVGTQRC